MNERPGIRTATLTKALSAAMLFTVTSCGLSEQQDSEYKTHHLQVLDAEFASGRHGYIDGLLLMQNDKLVLQSRYERDYIAPFEKIDAEPEEAASWGQGKEDYYYLDPEWHPWMKGGDLHTIQSVTKSVTSALIGIAILRGDIRSLDVQVAPLLDSEAPFTGDPRAEALTLRHLLTMTTGIAWNETNYESDENDGSLLELASDWQQYVLDKPFNNDPGTVFNYNSGTALLLDVVLLKSTGMHAAEYAEKHLFDPLGIDSYYWKTTPDGLSDTLGGLYLTAQDLARFGMLYANDGVWNGTRILPEGWVQDSFSPAISVAGSPDWTGEPNSGWMYGYQWWLLPDPDHPGKLIPVARGYGGQRLILLAEENVVAVLYGWNIMNGTSEYPDAEFLEQLVTAFRLQGQSK